MEKQMQTRELISALADGQLQGDAFVRGVEIAATDPLAREAWHTYHLIGDVLRSGELAAGTMPTAMPTAFLARLQLRLQQEQSPTGNLQAPRMLPPSAAPAARPEAANDESFRWKLVAGIASVAAFAAIGWSLVGANFGTERGFQNAPVLASGDAGVMIRDPRLDEFLAAHRQLGGASALQMPAGFLRNATFEGANR